MNLLSTTGIDWTLSRVRSPWILFVMVLLTLFVPGRLACGQNDPTATDAAAAPNTDAALGDSAAAEGEDGQQTSGTEKALTRAADDVKKTVEALQQGDLGTADSLWKGFLVSYGMPAITVILVLFAAYFIASFLARICSTPMRKRVDETLGRFVGKLVFYLVMVSSVLGVLQYFGIGVTSFAAIIASAGLAIGLAFQGTLSNFASGVMLLVFRPFKVGDVINAAGITAKVNEIDIFTTTFDTADNRRIIVPNGAIASGTIENISHHTQRRVDVAVGVDYSADLQTTRDTLIAAAESLNEFLIEGEGRGFQIILSDLGDSAVHWTIRFWTTSESFWSVKEQLIAAVKNHLDRAGIGIPFPQIDVHLNQNP